MTSIGSSSQGTTGRKLGELRGHTSSVCSIALDDNLNHVFTLSIDKSIKVWDLRNHRCLQTLLEVRLLQTLRRLLQSYQLHTILYIQPRP